MEKKYTKKQIFNAIIDAMQTGECEVSPTVIIDFMQREINALDRKAETAKARAAEKKAESDELSNRIYAMLTDAPQTINDILAAMNEEDLTSNKISSRLAKMAKGEIADKPCEKVEVSVPDANGKTRKLVAYKLT